VFALFPHFIYTDMPGICQIGPTVPTSVYTSFTMHVLQL